ncbi:MAG: cytochrome P450 [Gammaproteobacteria bacterium]|nr:cytochrome P450 [Gammaproteobacteria bacterium]
MATVAKDELVAGRNGVVIARRPNTGGTGYRTYEIHQRERVGESTEKIKPVQLISEAYLRDPYPLVGILRDNYPCYRNWLANSYWISGYNDVTSIFADDANFETRPKTWYYGMEECGRDLRGELPLLEAHARLIDDNAENVAERVVADFADRGEADLATEFAARFPLDLLTRLLDLPEGDVGAFVERYWRMQRGTSWDPIAQQAGLEAHNELVAYFDPLLSARRAVPGDDIVSAVAALELADGPATAADLVVTLLEADHQTLHGALANMWYLLLTNTDQFEVARTDLRLLKLAYLETLRHSAPVLSAERYARHEVERFGKLLPDGAQLVCSAAAANRDPRVFKDPDRFIVDRKDMCQREPRGQYRADGLATGIAFALGKPSKHPAVPEDRPRSLYAITRDTAVTASRVLLDSIADIRLQPGAEPHLASLRLGEMHTCWKLPVAFSKK